MKQRHQTVMLCKYLYFIDFSRFIEDGTVGFPNMGNRKIVQKSMKN